MPPDATSFTVDELAARTGITVRTLRFYAGRGLIPPPERRGRVGYYGEVHLARLELIRRLQDLGFTLTAIEGYLARLPTDAGPAEIRLLGTMMAPWTADLPVELSRAQVQERVGRRLSADDLELLAAFGVLIPAGRRFRAVPALLPMAADLLDLGLDPKSARRSQVVLERHTRAIAEELTAIFREQIWTPYRSGRRSDADREQLELSLQRLRSVTVRATMVALQQALNDAIRTRAARRGHPQDTKEVG